MTHPRLIFWVRLLSWLSIGCGIPVSVFAIKFGLFTRQTVQYDELGNIVSQTSTSLNGWGVVSIIVIGSFITHILKELASSCSGYSLLKQCYIGVCKTVPLIITFAVFYALNGVTYQILYCLSVLIVCRLISIPIDPLPKWRFEKTGAENYSTLVENIAHLIKRSEKEGV